MVATLAWTVMDIPNFAYWWTDVAGTFDKRPVAETGIDAHTGRVSPGSFGTGGPVTGETSYHWAVGGKWLLCISRLELPGVGRYEVHGGVAFNSRTGKYDAYAVNSLGNLLVYEGEWTDENTLAFMLVRPPPRDRARVVYHKLSDGSFRMTSENAAEEGEFVPYFEIDYVRA